MSWRVARSLLVLRGQIDALWPDRSKASDGTIGDAAHQASVSDHNPDDDVNGDGRGEGPAVADIVRALDITHDPAHGCDIDRLSDALAAARDQRVSYVIANRMITGPNYGWAWAAYSGDDPHTGHLHLSVVGDGRADDETPWRLPGLEGDDVSQRTDDLIHAWSQGVPRLADGTRVCPVEWRIRDEARQAEMDRQLAALTAQLGRIEQAASRPVQVTLTPEMLAQLAAQLIQDQEVAAERAVRRVLGELDGATP